MPQELQYGALVEDITLVTNNVAHFSKVKGLKLENRVSDT